MKTVQDWGFISKEQGLVKPKLQDNKIFHALTTAYENNQQQEIYGATENIVKREKELCEMALADLKRLNDGKGDNDGTLNLILEHYQSRLAIAREKEEKINHLSEDSRKMTEEYKKRTQELAEVKRNLMESQSKLRELAKTTEKLLKKEEELRFIESNLRSELDKNKRNIINGLYEIVSDLAEHSPEPIGIVQEPKPDVHEEASHLTLSAPDVSQNQPQDARLAPKPSSRTFTEGLFRHSDSAPAKSREEVAPSPPPSPARGVALPTETVWNRDKIVAPMFNKPVSPAPASQPSAPAQRPVAPTALHTDLGQMEKAARLKMFEPGKSMCNKSMVKTQDGEVISEYFYSPLHPKEARQYIFNSLFAVSSLLALRSKDEEAFQGRMETIFTDLLSRLEHGRNIHLESFLGEEINRDVLARILEMPRNSRNPLFDSLVNRILGRLESIGPSRAGLIDNQLRTLPKPDFPPSGFSA